MLSIQIDISTRRIVIIGGGQVAARKAAAVLAAGARDVTAIAPDFAADFPQEVRQVKKRYAPAHLAGAALVFAATSDPAVNAAVVRDAQAIGAWVNRADVGDDAGDFTLPAKVDFGDIRLTISTGSPALSTAIRQHLSQEWDHRWTALAAALKTLRPWIVAQSHLSADQRAAIFRDLASEGALEHSESAESLKAWAVSRYPELKQSDQPGER